MVQRRSQCPVSCTLDVLGDRWSLLVVRDVVRGKRRYAEFVESPEGIPTNILADRLKRLVAKGIVRPQKYSDHPPRVEYHLTAKGEDLRPIIRAMAEWGVQHAGGKMPPPVSVSPASTTPAATSKSARGPRTRSRTGTSPAKR
jgi:DNA-binding HxlR family transcriptional regulator